MHSFSKKLGIWTSLLITLTFIGWIVCFIGIAMSAPLFYWTNLSDYISFENTYNQTFQYLAKTMMWLFGPLFVLLLYSFYNYASPEKKDFVRISLLFALAFAILSSLHYFVQISTVRLMVGRGETEGLYQIIQANPTSLVSAINMLGWTFFLSLSCLFISPIFTGCGINRLLKFAFIFNGICCLSGLIGFLFQLNILTFLSMNLGTGAGILTISISSFFLFKKIPNPQ